MRIRTIVLVGLGVGAAALALAGCTGTARGDGNGQGIGANGGQGYRGARSVQVADTTAGRGYGRGVAATDDPARQVAPGRGAVRNEDGTVTSPLRGTVDPASDRTGREVADVGTLRTLEGTLGVEDTEWYLATADGRFLLHLGNTAYVEQAGLELQAGDPAVVKGLVDGGEVSVVSIEHDGKSYAFRTEDGRPLWGGGARGAGGARGTGRGGGYGAGRYEGTGA